MRCSFLCGLGAVLFTVVAGLAQDLSPFQRPGPKSFGASLGTFCLTGLRVAELWQLRSIGPWSLREPQQYLTKLESEVPQDPRRTSGTI